MKYVLKILKGHFFGTLCILHAYFLFFLKSTYYIILRQSIMIFKGEAMSIFKVFFFVFIVLVSWREEKK